MSRNRQGDSDKDLIELSAKLIHDVSTPMAIVKVNNEFIARYLPTLLSAYESQASEHPERNLIPPDHLQALSSAPSLVEEQCARIARTMKAHWRCVNQQRTIGPDHMEEPRPRSKPFVSRMQILLVEDEAVHRDIALAVLSPAHHLDIATSGQEAIRKCESKPYDLVLMDIYLPDLDGRQATKLIRRTHRHELTIIALSNMPTNEAELREAGFDGQLNKPLSLEAFKQSLQSAQSGLHEESSE